MVKSIFKLFQRIRIIRRDIVPQLKPRIDRICWILAALAVTFSIIIPLPYYVYMYIHHVYFIPYWTFIVWVIRGLGILSLLALAAYQLFRIYRTNMKK